MYLDGLFDQGDPTIAPVIYGTALELRGGSYRPPALDRIY